MKNKYLHFPHMLSKSYLSKLHYISLVSSCWFCPLSINNLNIYFQDSPSFFKNCLFLNCLGFVRVFLIMIIVLLLPLLTLALGPDNKKKKKICMSSCLNYCIDKFEMGWSSQNSSAETKYFMQVLSESGKLFFRRPWTQVSVSLQYQQPWLQS